MFHKTKQNDLKIHRSVKLSIYTCYLYCLGQKISCNHLIMNEKFCNNDDCDVIPKQKFHRAVYINDNTICDKIDADKTDPVS